MQVVNVKEENGIYTVELKPNFLQRLFGMKNRVEEYKKVEGEVYTDGYNGVYNRKDGVQLGNYHYIQVAIDKYIRAW